MLVCYTECSSLGFLLCVIAPLITNPSFCLTVEILTQTDMSIYACAYTNPFIYSGRIMRMLFKMRPLAQQSAISYPLPGFLISHLSHFYCAHYKPFVPLRGNNSLSLAPHTSCFWIMRHQPIPVEHEP